MLSRKLLLAIAAITLAIIAVATWRAPEAAQGQPDGRPAPLATFRGSAKAVYGPIELQAGLTVVRARSNGNANFVVWLVRPEPGEEVVNAYGDRTLLINATNTYNGASVALASTTAPYYLEVAAAAGAYELIIEQPTPANVAPVEQRAFSGRVQQVSPYFWLPAGSYTVNVQADAYALRAWLYRLDDLGGAAVISPLTGYFSGKLIDTTIPPGYTSVPVDLPEDGIYLLYIWAEGTESLAWTISVD